jgi:hypothetical protein
LPVSDQIKPSSPFFSSFKQTSSIPSKKNSNIFSKKRNPNQENENSTQHIVKILK